MPLSSARAPWLPLALLFASALTASVIKAAGFPAPLKDLPAAANHQPQTAVLAGGCFWGVEDVFEHLKGVVSAVSGYAGGSKSTAVYETVGTGQTGHAES